MTKHRLSKMSENATSIQSGMAAAKNSTVDSTNTATHDSDHFVGALAIFVGTILLIGVLFTYCWFRCLWRSMAAHDTEAANGGVNNDTPRRDTLVVTLNTQRRFTRWNALDLPFSVY